MFQPIIPGSFTAARWLRGRVGIHTRESGSAAPIFPSDLATELDGSEDTDGAIRTGELVGTAAVCCSTETSTTPAAAPSITVAITIAAEPMAAAVYMERALAPMAHAPERMERAAASTELAVVCITAPERPLGHLMEAGKQRAATVNRAGRLVFAPERTVATTTAARAEAFPHEGAQALAVGLVVPLLAAAVADHRTAVDHMAAVAAVATNQLRSVTNLKATP